MTTVDPAFDGGAAVRIRLRSVLRRPLLLASSLILIGVIAAVSLAAVIAPHPPLAQDLLNAFAAPSAEHPLGTDGLGRDVLSRLLHGGQPALSGVAIAVAVFAVLGMSLGILAGYLRGWVDRVVVGLIDVMLSVPGIILILAVLAIFDQNVAAAMVVLGLFASANLARQVRSACIGLREELFVDAARVSGLGPFLIMFRHILPGLIGVMFVQSALFASIALVVQTGLGFLGLATPAPAASWGGMVGEASQVIQQHPTFLLITGGVIGIMALAFGLLGDGLRDVEADRRRTAGAIRPPVVSAAPTAAPRDADALLVVRDLTVAFGTPTGGRTVVDGVSFDVRPGEIVGLVGESGSGKTMTALSLLGLLPDNGAVIAGGAWLNGERIAPADAATLRRIRGREIGLVSQEPMVALDPHYTVGAQLGEVVRTIGGARGRDEIRKESLRLLWQVKLPDPEGVLKRYPHELSGGMIQRVVIAIALAGDPELLLADEPTTALDVTVQAGILDLLRELRDTRGMAVVLVTHDLGVVADVCERVIVMQNGTIVEQGVAEQLFDDPQHEYTQKLLASTPSILGRTHD
jgi:peptide/nickel transport system permease protein